MTKPDKPDAAASAVSPVWSMENDIVRVGYLDDSEHQHIVPRWAYKLIRQGAVDDYVRGVFEETGGKKPDLPKLPRDWKGPFTMRSIAQSAFNDDINWGVFDAGRTCIVAHITESEATFLTALLNAAWDARNDKAELPEIVCLCGSTRFADQHAIKRWELERDGKAICVMINYLPSWYAHEQGWDDGNDHFGEQSGKKEILDELHFRKIDLADRVFVLNVDGYIGESTANEIAYAEKTGKLIDYLEPLNAQKGGE